MLHRNRARKLSEMFDATVLVDVEPLPEPLGPVSGAMARRDVRRCERCALRETCREPVAWTGTIGSGGALVVGEAPGKDEDDRGVPFVGRSGKLLRALLAQAGFDVDHCVFGNAVACRPPGNRTPTTAEMAACRPHLTQLLRHSNSRWAVLVGGTSLKAFRADLKVSEVHGVVMVWGGPWGGMFVMPTYHPAAALRDRALRGVILADLEHCRLAMRTWDEGGGVAFGASCTRCGEPVEWYDANAVPYCSRHAQRYGRSGEEAERAWRRAAADVGRATLDIGQGTDRRRHQA